MTTELTRYDTGAGISTSQPAGAADPHPLARRRLNRQPVTTMPQAQGRPHAPERGPAADGWPVSGEG